MNRSVPDEQLHFGKTSRGGAYELKFVIANDVADQVLEIARQTMRPDPHAETDLDDGYHINSLYFDTPSLDVFSRNGKHARRKLRLRRYAKEPTIYVERKSKRKGIVTKRRSSVDAAALSRLLDPYVLGQGTDGEWSGDWFHRRIARDALRPMCHVSYVRTARVHQVPEGIARLTIDRQLICRPADGVSFPRLEDGIALLNDVSILELKYRATLPTMFNTLIREFGLVSTSYSKYRTGVVACNLHVGLATGDEKDCRTGPDPVADDTTLRMERA